MKMQNEILKFCLQKGLLVDKTALEIFQEIQDTESVKLIIEKFHEKTQEKFLSKNIFEKNKPHVEEIFSELSSSKFSQSSKSLDPSSKISLSEKQKNLEKLKIKLGITLEIEKEISSAPEKEISSTSRPQTSPPHTSPFLSPSSIQSSNPPSQSYTPTPHEVIQQSSEKFSQENFSPNLKIQETHFSIAKKLEVKDFVKYFSNRFQEMSKILLEHSELENPISIGKISDSRNNFSIIGIVTSKRITKNKNLLLEVEDLSGKTRVLVNHDKSELFEKAENIPLDGIIGFKVSGKKEIVFANEIIFPESKLPERKNSPQDESAIFLGDIHFGSKRFLETEFKNFLSFLKNENEKIKYIFIVGDLVTGVGNYPNQEQDLKIKDLEEQFENLAELFSKIKKEIQIIISPGNHDGVRLMEPQPLLDEKYAWPLYDLKNITFTTNPARINIGAQENFSGFDILTYHGFSFPYYANNIPQLVTKRAMDQPEEIMKYLLQQRHLAPTHTSVQYFPSEQDPLLIKKIPDIFVSAHTHKSGVSYYNNTLVVSTSCWESMTPYQEKFGNNPDHCKVPLFNLKTRAVKILDFENKEDQEQNFENKEEEN